MGREKVYGITLSVALMVFLPSMASGEMVHFSIELNGLNIVPDPVATMGTGAGWARLDPSTNTLEWSIAYGDLTGPATAAHFHGPADPSGTAGPQLTLDFSQNPIVGSDVITVDQASDLLDGKWYANIHTEAYSTGEIRGQLTRVIPEPMSLSLLGLGGLALWRKRRG